MTVAKDFSIPITIHKAPIHQFPIDWSWKYVNEYLALIGYWNPWIVLIKRWKNNIT